MALQWIDVEDGYQSGNYRICPAGRRSRRRWQLEISAWPGGPDGSPAEFATTFHGTLRLAMAHAEHIEAERVSRRRITGYLAIACVATAAVFVLAPITNSVELFVVTMVFVGVAVRSFANAAGLAYGDAWTWTRDDGAPVRVTWADRAVVRAMDRLRPAVPTAPRDLPTAVRVLPPASGD